MTGTTTIQDEVSKLTIAKKDITGKQEVTGAKLTLTLTKPDESGATLDDVTANIRVDSRTEDSITWTSGKTDAILSKLPDGEYTLKETGGAFTDTETGKTYTVIESTMTFTVENGVVTSTTGDADNLNDKATDGYYYYDKTAGQILVCDAEAVNVVPISKQDAGSGAEVAGATLEITAENVLDTTKLELSRTDKNGNKTVLVKGTDYSISADGKTIQFVSGEDATIITGLPAGTYKLKETNAPDGYQLYTAEETFTIGTDGKVTGTTTIQDEVSKLTIAKKDITGKQEVTGAKLTLTLTKPDESGATLGDVTANIRVDSRDAKSITWTSGKTDAILSKLPDGEYTLKETGGAFTDEETGKTYTVIESTMTFTVENGVITKSNAADNLNDKATKGYYYCDKTAGQILVCDAEQPAITTTSTSETTTTTTTTTSTSESSTTSDTETTTGTGTVTTVSTVATTSKTSETTTEVTTDTTLATSGNTTETSAGPTTTSTSETTTEVTTDTTLATSGNTTETSAGPTTTSTSETTTEVTTDTTLATSGNTTETSAGPTTTSTSETTTEVTTGTTLATSGNTTETSAGPTTTSTSETTTEVTTGTTLATSGNTTETSAGPTTTSTNGTTTDTTTAKTTVTTASASTETSAASTTTTAAGTTAETVTETSTTAASTATTAETTVTTAATTTIEATTTTTEETTVETTTTTEETTTTIVTTTEQPDGYVIRKCDVGGNEIGGASLNITDQSGNVIDQWVSEEGVSHVFAGIQPNTPYCLTETLAPADYLVAEPIYFQLNEDGTLVLFVGVSLNEDGSWSVENAVVTANPDGRAIVMIDEYVGTETTTTETTEETTTTTEATTTTAKNTTAGNGEHTPSVSTTTTASTETTTVTGESGTGTTAGSGGSGTTTAAGGSQTTTVIRSNSGSSSPVRRTKQHKNLLHAKDRRSIAGSHHSGRRCTGSGNRGRLQA